MTNSTINNRVTLFIVAFILGAIAENYHLKFENSAWLLVEFAGDKDNRIRTLIVPNENECLKEENNFKPEPLINHMNDTALCFNLITKEIKYNWDEDHGKPKTR